MNVLITGATKGIGKGIAEKFAANGANLAICSRNENELEAFKKTLVGKFGIEVLAFRCDMSEKKEVLEFTRKIKAKWKNIDVLVNNAGVFIPGNVMDEKDRVLENIMDVNLFGAYHLTRSLLDLMIPNKKGHIFNMTSVASLNAYPNGGFYSISKFALLGFTKALREELKEHNISVTALNMGAVYTPSWESAGLPESRFADVKDIAELVFSIYSLSERTVVEEILIRPMLGDI